MRTPSKNETSSTGNKPLQSKRFLIAIFLIRNPKACIYTFRGRNILKTMAKTETQLNECCVVPYRITAYGPEFCLVTPHAENRWEFPKVKLGRNDVAEKVRDAAAAMAGLVGQISADQIGSFVASRKNETRNMVGFLMRVDDSLEAWPKRKSHRRLWCLAEEARVRIRRKPLRRFIDLALQNVRETPRLPR